MDKKIKISNDKKQMMTEKIQVYFLKERDEDLGDRVFDTCSIKKSL